MEELQKNSSSPSFPNPSLLISLCLYLLFLLDPIPHFSSKLLPFYTSGHEPINGQEKLGFYEFLFWKGDLATSRRRLLPRHSQDPSNAGLQVRCCEWGLFCDEVLHHGEGFLCCNEPVAILLSACLSFLLLF